MTLPHEILHGRVPPRRLLAGLGALSFALSLGFALARGRERFVNDGYSFYIDIARTLLDGGGLCFGSGESCAVRGPVYPLLVALFLKVDLLYPGLSVLQAALTALLPALVFGIAVRVANRRVALLSALLTAVAPYGVIHGTALQDTGVFNALAMLSVYLLLRAAESTSPWPAAIAGLSMAATTLTAFRFAFFIPCAVVWLAFVNGRSERAIGRSLVMVLPIVIALGGWTVRNMAVVGAPVLTTEGGLNIWVANNPTTLAYFPKHSMDRNIGHSLEHLPPERAGLRAGATEVEADRLAAAWAWQEISAQPLRAGLNMARKIGHAFSGQLSPARDGAIQVVFAVVYVPLHLLAGLGVWQLRAVRGPRLVLHLLLGSYGVTSALFWAHTSHASYLHPVVFVGAAVAVIHLVDGWRWSGQVALGRPSGDNAAVSPNPAAAVSSRVEPR